MTGTAPSASRSVRAVAAESLLLKYQLLISNRARKRATRRAKYRAMLITR
jgi:hypothetical protein